MVQRHQRYGVVGSRSDRDDEWEVAYVDGMWRIVGCSIGGISGNTCHMYLWIGNLLSFRPGIVNEISVITYSSSICDAYSVLPEKCVIPIVLSGWMRSQSIREEETLVRTRPRVIVK